MSSGPSALPQPRFSAAMLAGFVLAATLLVYLGTLQFEFVYDDLGQIVSNPAVQSWKYFPLYFRQNVWMQQFAVGNYYRPVFLTWLLLNHTFFGLHPALWHLTTVLAHLGATALVFALALRLTADRRVAAIAALLFGLHPVHLEAVAWISGVTEPLLAMLLIPAFLCYLNWREAAGARTKWLAGSLVLYALALLSKETAVVLPALVFVYEWVFAADGASWRAKLNAGLRAGAAYVVITGAYLLARSSALHGLAHKTVELPAGIALLTIPSALWWYIRLLVAPIGLSVFYDTPYVTHIGFRYFVLPLLGVAVAIGVLAWWWKRSRSPLVAFAAAWLFLPILPLLDLAILPMGDFIHDRYLYLPSVGLAILVAIALAKLDARQLLGRPAGQVVALTLAVVMGFAIVAQSIPWANDLVLYYHGMRVAPNNDLPRNKLAASLVQRGMYAEGIRLYRLVLAADPDYWYANYRMGYAHYMSGNFAEAESYLARAVTLHATPDELYYLGLSQSRLGKRDEAAKALQAAVRLQPESQAYKEALAEAQKTK
ncbi:MAG: tetratricopeptide repeat protein [Terriglobales bacterium]